MKAAVLPLPVCADTMRSAPSSVAGIAASWTGVASLKPARLIEESKTGASPSESKDMTFLLAR